MGTRAAAGSQEAAGPGPGSRDRADPRVVRAVLDQVVRDGEPVLKVATVVAWASLDRDVPLRHTGLLLDVLTDPAVRPRFEQIWFPPDVESAFTRDDVAAWVTGLFGHRPHTALSFVIRLAEAADRTGDTGLHRVALDEAWRLLVPRPSLAPRVLPLAARLLDHPDDCVRLKAVHLLAILAPLSAPYADRLAALIDDPGTDRISWIEGTVGDFARWALVRLDDPRALPGLVEALWAPYREQYARGYATGDPRGPEIHEVLAPLREHADVLLPVLRREVRLQYERDGDHGPLTGVLVRVAEAWGPAALPALPELMPLLKDTRYSLSAVDALVAMGPGAASTAPAVRDAVVLDHAANHRRIAWAAWRIGGGDDDAVLRLLGEAVEQEPGPAYGPVSLLADFGSAAAAHGERVRHIMDTAEGLTAVEAAVALAAITGDPRPGLAVLEQAVTDAAGDDDGYGFLLWTLRAFLRIGATTPGARHVLHQVRARDRRLSAHSDYRAVLDDEEARSLIEAVLALP
ncbi:MULTISPECIES: hypothetical protein [Streptomyces]|uniref:HEAT repeat domain-containing protein n=1 Tax=Streptomyces lienomycini TaxID=284035 RepID=A0ABV9X6V0_9ACTN|nr:MULTISPECIES: hypothetical protein [Streptomyces]